jgi:hypothetical protein
MSERRIRRQWDGSNMAHGNQAGRVEVRTFLGVEASQVTTLRTRKVERNVEGGIVRVTIGELRRHASVRLRKVPAESPVEAADGAWTPALVEARLRRASETFRAMPGAADIWPAGHRSCMPTPVREPFKDSENDKPRPRPGRDEVTLAVTTWEWLVDTLFDLNDATRFALAEAVANNLRTGKQSGWRAVAKAMRARPDCRSVSYRHAPTLARKVLVELAQAWTAAGYAFDEVDIRRAVSLQASRKSVVIH